MHDPSEVIYAVTVRDILSAIKRRMGEVSSSLPEEDIRLACEEVKAVMDDSLDVRDFIETGLDNWMIVRNL